MPARHPSSRRARPPPRGRQHSRSCASSICPFAAASASGGTSAGTRDGAASRSSVTARSPLSCSPPRGHAEGDDAGRGASRRGQGPRPAGAIGLRRRGPAGQGQPRRGPHLRVSRSPSREPCSEACWLGSCVVQDRRPWIAAGRPQRVLEGWVLDRATADSRQGRRRNLLAVQATAVGTGLFAPVRRHLRLAPRKDRRKFGGPRGTIMRNRPAPS